MGYQISQVMHQLWREKWKYLFIFAQCVICLTLILMGLNEQHSYAYRRDVLMYDRSHQLTTISSVQGDLLNQTVPDDLLDRQYIIYHKRSLINYLTTDDDIGSIYLVRGNQAFFDTYFPDQPVKKGVAYGDKDVIVSLGKVDGQTLTEGIAFYSDKVVIEEKMYTYDSIVPSRERIPFQAIGSDDIDTSNALFILASDLVHYGDDEGIPVIKTSSSLTDVADLVIEMTHLNPNNRYEAVDLLGHFDSRVADMRSTVQLFSWIGYVAMIMIAFGIIGIMMLIFHKRQKSYIIHHLFGATWRILAIQMASELSILMISAFLLSIVAAGLIQPVLSTDYFPIVTHGSSVGLTGFIVISIIMINTMWMTYNLSRLKLTNWLI